MWRLATGNMENASRVAAIRHVRADVLEHQVIDVVKGKFR